MSSRSVRVRASLSLALMVLALGVVAPPAAAASPVVDGEQNLRPELLSFGYPRNDAFDPIVATHPTDPATLAVSYHWKPRRGAPCGFAPGLRITTDGGATWHEAARRPWAGSGRLPNWHATIYFGPGPAPGSARLYWADTTVSSCAFNDHRLSVAWSDDLGATWSPLYVYKGTPATSAGGYPDLTVDRNPASPSFGAVYAAINWFEGNAEPGYRVIASTDFGASWKGHEIPPLDAPAAYPYAYRIGYRLRSAPDGGLFASFCQRDRRSPSGATGRLAWGVARLHIDAKTGALTGSPARLALKVGRNKYNLSTANAPGSADWQALGTCWSHGIDVDATGRLYLAVADYRPKVTAEGRGVIRLGFTDNAGADWTWQRLPAAADLGGRHQSSYRPTLVASGETVFVGMHLLVDVALGKKSTAATVANAYSVSYDRGATFSVPQPIGESRWHPDWLDHKRNGPGIRDRAELTADGRVVYVYGDGRNAAAKPDPRWGRGAVYLSAISLAPEPPPGP
ncbi:MAG TPA: sialidase family protein [Candidatus Limnocylindrales bacterium]